jgi:hypothetical protein
MALYFVASGFGLGFAEDARIPRGPKYDWSINAFCSSMMVEQRDLQKMTEVLTHCVRQ